MSEVTDVYWDGIDPPDVFVDMLGQEIRVGDFVCYSTSNSSSAYVNIGRVLEFRIRDAKGEPLGSTRYDYDAPWDPTLRQPRPSFFQYHWKFYLQPIMSGSGYRGKDKNVLVGTVHNILKVDVSNATFAIPDAEVSS